MKFAVVLLVIIILFMISSIRIYIDYKREGENDRVKVTFEYLKIIRFSFTIPFMDVDKKDKEYGLKIKTKVFSSNTDEGFIDLKSLLNMSEKIKHYYEIYTGTFDKIISSIKRGLIVEKLMVYLTVGLEDCAITAVSIGIIHAIFNGLYGYIDNKIRILNHEIIVEPYYNKFYYRINFNCIFKISIGNIIYVGGLIIYLLLLHTFQVFKKPKIKININ